MLYILTLNWNGKEKIEKLYHSLVFSLKNLNYQWVIKDNASKDGSVEFLKSIENDQIKVIYYPHNRQNFSEGNNVCYEACNPQDEDFILLLNNDIVFNDDKSIQSMMDLLTDDVGIVGARLCYENTDTIQHAGIVFLKNYYNGEIPKHYLAGEKTFPKAKKNNEFQAVTGACLLTKSKYYKQNCVNSSGRVGLNEKYFFCFEDVDFCLNVKYNMNKKIICCGSTEIFHEESYTLKKNPVQKMFMPQNLALFKSTWNGKYKIDNV